MTSVARAERGLARPLSPSVIWNREPGKGRFEPPPDASPSLSFLSLFLPSPLWTHGKERGRDGKSDQVHRTTLFSLAAEEKLGAGAESSSPCTSKPGERVLPVHPVVASSDLQLKRGCWGWGSSREKSRGKWSTRKYSKLNL